MGIAHRATFPWLMAVIFLCFLDLRLEEKVLWSWYLVFSPLYIFDCAALIYLSFKMVKHCKNGYDRSELTIPRKTIYLVAVFLKLAFQFMVCARLEHFDQLPVYYVAIPMLLLLSGAVVDVFRSLVLMARRP